MRENQSHKVVIEIKELKKMYEVGGQKIQALRSVNLSISEGEFVAIMGPSGSGKSTMMNVIGCLDHPDTGEYYLDGYSILDARENELSEIRNQKLGFVFQKFYLLPRTTALANVELPMMYAGIPAKERRERAVEALRSVGLAERMYNKPNELSGGQQQRVSIARALVNNPVILLADEPTGALDTKTSVEIMELFQGLNELGKTIVLVTHELEIAEYAKRLISFRDGNIERDERITNRRISSRMVSL
ncbi:MULTISPECIES: ABC transporter ATP-binding protein [Paenibacillus]|jgi:putative ABC transport system ATP-binding protein|uniref:Macrolide ABC transporter ATP-binding protein n=2 Tax=Paenibacillus polymyxa TaxID=1406 RepID=A0ABX2ZBI1_PAEPO|nr:MULTISPECIES: ABC transporter ATP-binding protein [Paenibacillus]ALA40557.1 macrolide ABC transporter ATP-binding protein [Paenibacillus peoriae]ODA07486.1 macrolide ABC transporter ATP-binding protein [Paenibacillus polymyxa]OME64592.1 macrolide ABC transporter ATP-binding protein [Paenibacillus peoriae]OMF23108.1 macrolide ABC transporter ATP-binding protein [Paenibacillus peoriae]OMF65603.1 macrolide ABC transporter ATP-binding protein [Paenibacillus peoriae]